MKPPDIESPLIQACRELLRVEPGVQPDDLKTAFRAMARVYHPDTSADPLAADVFMRVKEAYDILSQPQKIQELNERYLQQRYCQPCVQGLNLTFGSFFGHRFPTPGNTPLHTPDPRFISAGVEYDVSDNPQIEGFTPDVEGSRSILDDPAFDYAEVILAGEMSRPDRRTLARAFREKDFSSLPWYVLNNEAIVKFLNRDYLGALIGYEALNLRLPDNIVFLYRLGLCHQLVGFRFPLRLPVLGDVPNRRHLRAAVKCYRRAIRLGEQRTDAPQRCLTIRKNLADLLERMHLKLPAHQVWRRIHSLEPRGREARQKLQQTRPHLAGLLPASLKH